MLFYFSGSLSAALSNINVTFSSIVKLISKHQIFSFNCVSFMRCKLYGILILIFVENIPLCRRTKIH